MICFPDALPSARLEAALLRSEFSIELQGLLSPFPMWVEGNQLFVWYSTAEARLSEEAGRIYELLKRKVPVVAPGIEDLVFVDWQHTVTFPVTTVHLN